MGGTPPFIHFVVSFHTGWASRPTQTMKVFCLFLFATGFGTSVTICRDFAKLSVVANISRALMSSCEIGGEKKIGLTPKNR